MAIGLTTTVNAPIEAYDATHRALLGKELPPDLGILFHVARATADGVEITEVWESQEKVDHFLKEILPSILGEVGEAGGASAAQTSTWEVRGLIVPSAGVFS